MWCDAYQMPHCLRGMIGGSLGRLWGQDRSNVDLRSWRTEVVRTEKTLLRRGLRRATTKSEKGAIT